MAPLDVLLDPEALAGEEVLHRLGAERAGGRRRLDEHHDGVAGGLLARVLVEVDQRVGVVDDQLQAAFLQQTTNAVSLMLGLLLAL